MNMLINHFIIAYKAYSKQSLHNKMKCEKQVIMKITYNYGEWTYSLELF